jgi:hypothetical protein
MILINGKSYSPRPLTAGDLEAILPLLMGLGHVDKDAGVLDLAELLPDALDAVSMLLQCDRADLAALPLHTALQTFDACMQGWLECNGAYLATQVAPALQGLTRTLAQMVTAVPASAAPATGAGQ